MLFLNTYEIEEALRRYADHPVLGPATQQLAELEEWTNSNSDGWAYWPKPRRAATKLQDLIGTTRAYLDDPERADVTPELYRAALRPIKAFRTRQGADFDLYELSV
jgi:hypothetical protein